MAPTAKTKYPLFGPIPASANPCLDSKSAWSVPRPWFECVQEGSQSRKMLKLFGLFEACSTNCSTFRCTVFAQEQGVKYFEASNWMGCSCRRQTGSNSGTTKCSRYGDFGRSGIANEIARACATRRQPNETRQSVSRYFWPRSVKSGARSFATPTSSSSEQRKLAATLAETLSATPA